MKSPLKFAGRSRAGRKLSPRAYESMASRLSPEEMTETNRQALAVVPQEPPSFDDSAFFESAHGIDSFLPPNSQAALDAMIEHHGLKNLLSALQLLLEARVDSQFLNGDGNLLLHLARDDQYARVAERIRTLTYDRDVETL